MEAIRHPEEIARKNETTIQSEQDNICERARLERELAPLSL